MTYRIEFDDEEYRDMQKDVLKAIYVLRKCAYEVNSPELNGLCMESSILLKMVWDKISTLKS